ncbi:MAG: alpha/beta fold hydrolase [Candidatus Izemoplasmataceae bacterium]
MTSDHQHILTPDGTKLSVIKYVPTSAPKAILHIFHGMGEHKKRYIPFMEFMVNQGYVVIAHDHRKHGESIPKKDMQGIFLRGDNWDKVLNDASLVADETKVQHPNLPYIILGHSMGSIILRRFLIDYKNVADKAIIMGTLPPYSKAMSFIPIMLARFVSFFKREGARSPFIFNLVGSPLQKHYDNPRTPFDWLTHDDKIVDAYIKDPYCGYPYTPKFYQEFFKGILGLTNDNFLQEGKDIPILFISGKEDPVGNNGEGVKKVFEAYQKNNYTNLTLLLIDNARHEILNELNKQATYHKILNWIESN